MAQRKSVANEVWLVRPDYGQENVYRIWDQLDNYHTDTSVEAMDRRAQLIACAPDLLDTLIMALPYVECAESDPGYKRGAVAKITRRIREIIARADSK